MNDQAKIYRLERIIEALKVARNAILDVQLETTGDLALAERQILDYKKEIEDLKAVIETKAEES